MKNKSDDDWKAKAREHQSWFREHILKVPCVPNSSRSPICYGNVISEEDAAKGLTFFEPFRKEIMEAVKKGKASPFICTNLLRSEHIPYNLFFPMRHYLSQTAELFRRLTKLDIAVVKDIKIEYPTAPTGKTNPFLNDRTAFDTYIEYLDSENRLCGIGIEVKYTEKGYPIGDSEKKKVNDPNSTYHQVSKNGNIYVNYDSTKDKLAKNDLRQIWRNHILGIAMVQQKKIHRFLSIHLYPSFNEHFNKVIPEYEAMLAPHGKETFMPCTFESLFDAMVPIVFGEYDKQWKAYLRQRYIDFSHRI